MWDPSTSASASVMILVVPDLFDVEVLADPGTDRGDERLDLGVGRESCRVEPFRR